MTLPNFFCFFFFGTESRTPESLPQLLRKQKQTNNPMAHLCNGVFTPGREFISLAAAEVHEAHASE
jgi:hypothetical protein